MNVINIIMLVMHIPPVRGSGKMDEGIKKYGL